MLKVYTFAKVNPLAHGRTRDLRVLWALEEMQLPHEIVGLDHPAGELFTEPYRALSPFQQIPAIDDDGQVISESGAIVLHLARRSGRLMPADDAGRAQVLRWCFAAMNSIEMPLMNLMIHDWTHAGEGGAPREFLLGWVRRMLSNLDRWLDGRRFVATDEFTVADILTAHVLSAGVKDPATVDPYPAVAAYRDRCMARPAWQRTIEAYRTRVVAG